MPEKTVVLREFKTADEAHLALECLRAASIYAFVTGDTPIPTTFSIFGRMQYDAIRLHVDVSQVQRAKELLASIRSTRPEKGWESRAEDAIDGWICGLCDTEVENDATICPACGEARPERKKKRRRE